MITEPGIYPDIVLADYFADPCPEPSLSQSVAKTLLDRSPLHAYHEHPRLGGTEPDDYKITQALGVAAHRLMFGRGRDIAVLDAPDFKTKAAQNFRDDAILHGRVPILERDAKRAGAMVAVAKRRLDAMGIKLAGDAEVMLAWRELGTWFRTLVDLLSDDHRIVLDYKTSSRSCAPHDLGRLMADSGWDIQGAMHERGLNALEGEAKRRHLFIAQENEEPFELVIAELDRATLDMGHRKLDHAADRWRRCLAADKWPGYPLEIVVPEYPAWAEMQWLKRETHEAAERRVPRSDAVYDLSGG